MSKNSYGRRPKRPTGNRPPSSISMSNRRSANQPGSEQEQEIPGILGWLVRNRRLLGWLELVAAIFLVGLAVNGFLSGALYLPFGFGLLGLRFFYAYVQHTLGVNFGRIGPILNIVLLLAALVCVILGITLESSTN